MNYNPKESNQELPQVIEGFIEWDDSRGITSGSSPLAQWTKLFEESIEMYCALRPEADKATLYKSLLGELNTLYRKDKLKQIPSGDDPQEHLSDAVGDTMKCLTSVANLSGINLTESSQSVLTIINARGGSLNSEGVWEKDS